MKNYILALLVFLAINSVFGEHSSKQGPRAKTFEEVHRATNEYYFRLAKIEKDLFGIEYKAQGIDYERLLAIEKIIIGADVVVDTISSRIEALGKDLWGSDYKRTHAIVPELEKIEETIFGTEKAQLIRGTYYSRIKKLEEILWGETGRPEPMTKMTREERLKDLEAILYGAPQRDDYRLRELETILFGSQYKPAGDFLKRLSHFEKKTLLGSDHVAQGTLKERLSVVEQLLFGNKK